MKVLSRKKITIDDLIHFDGENLKSAKRSLREPLLKAFDIYKSNVNYGIEIETIEENSEIVYWYRKLLDLEESALENIPKKIARYL